MATSPTQTKIYRAPKRPGSLTHPGRPFTAQLDVRPSAYIEQEADRFTKMAADALHEGIERAIAMLEGIERGDWTVATHLNWGASGPLASQVDKAVGNLSALGGLLNATANAQAEQKAAVDV